MKNLLEGKMIEQAKNRNYFAAGEDKKQIYYVIDMALSYPKTKQTFAGK